MNFKSQKTTYFRISVIQMLLASVLVFSMTKDQIFSNHVLFSFANLMSYMLCIVSWCKMGGRPFSMYVFFVAYAYLCNAGQSLLYSLGMSDLIMYTYMHESVADITKMLRFQYLCVSALNLGVCTYLYNHRIPSIDDMKVCYNNYSVRPKSYDRLLDILMFISLLSIAYTCFNMFIMRQTLDYMDYFQAGRGEDNAFIGGLIDLLSIILPTRCLFMHKHVKVVYAFYAFFIFMFMIVGSRGMAIRYIALTLICLPMTNPELFKKQYIAFWLGGIVVGFAFMGVISVSRASALSVSSFDVSGSFGDSFFKTLDDMGNSERPAVLGMTATESGLGHKQTILYTIVCGFIPFTSSIPYFQDQYIYLGDYLTDMVGSFSGLGSSYIGECFLNYGWYGWIFMLVYGFFAAAAETTAYKKIINGETLIALLLLAILSRQVAFGRSEFMRLAPLFRWSEIIIIISLFFKRTR